MKRAIFLFCACLFLSAAVYADPVRKNVWNLQALARSAGFNISIQAENRFLNGENAQR